LKFLPGHFYPAWIAGPRISEHDFIEDGLVLRADGIKHSRQYISMANLAWLLQANDEWPFKGKVLD
jgi:hypothetical protein